MIESHAAFWQDAGVDLAFIDEAQDMLAAAEAANAPDAPPRIAPVELPPARPLGPSTPDVAAVSDNTDHWPDRLEAFAPWWLAEPSLDSGPADRRVPPRGAAGAELMVIVAQPESVDTGTLLSGPEGALLDAIERAMGLAPGAIYRASALPRLTPAADWAEIAAAGMGAVLRRHVQLVAPKRLLVLSREVVALLAPEKFDADGTGVVVAGTREIPVIAAYPLAQMAPRAGYKRIFWQRWLAFANRD